MYMVAILSRGHLTWHDPFYNKVFRYDGGNHNHLQNSNVESQNHNVRVGGKFILICICIDIRSCYRLTCMYSQFVPSTMKPNHGKWRF